MKPLAERVEWRDQPVHGMQLAQATIGGIAIEVIGPIGGEYRIGCDMLPTGRMYVKDAGLPAAKLEALRIVQRAVLEAAEHWRD